MKRLLLYSPDVVGHPPVYCRVIADAVAGPRCEVVVAMGFTSANELPRIPDVVPLAARPYVTIVDTRLHSAAGQPHLSAEELRQLQADFRVDTTLFIEADKSNDQFSRMAAGTAPRLIGRNVGIYANTAEWYPGEDSFDGRPKRLIAPTVRTTLGNLKRALFDRKSTARHFYENTILGTGVLDEIYVKDERLAERFGPPVYWMPEISRPALPDELLPADDEERRREAELDAFLDSNPGREPVLYFGDAAGYKGYDLFLEFIARNPSTCGLHAGQTYDTKHAAGFQYDVASRRQQLRSEQRLLETNAYVSSQRLKELYFGAVRLYITTHRLVLSSSTIIQAIEMGKPVLVPDRGVLAYRVLKNRIGEVYRYGDLDDLSRKAAMMWNSDLTRFIEPARTCYERFSDESIRRFFVQRLLT